jgi:hypothetical protein
MHSKNHHYSLAARIGKLKESRNRKTLLRLRDAVATTSQPL